MSWLGRNRGSRGLAPAPARAARAPTRAARRTRSRSGSRRTPRAHGDRCLRGKALVQVAGAARRRLLVPRHHEERRPEDVGAQRRAALVSPEVRTSRVFSTEEDRQPSVDELGVSKRSVHSPDGQRALGMDSERSQRSDSVARNTSAFSNSPGDPSSVIETSSRSSRTSLRTDLATRRERAARRNAALDQRRSPDDECQRWAIRGPGPGSCLATLYLVISNMIATVGTTISVTPVEDAKGVEYPHHAERVDEDRPQLSVPKPSMDGTDRRSDPNNRDDRSPTDDHQSPHQQRERRQRVVVRIEGRLQERAVRSMLPDRRSARIIAVETPKQ